MGLGLLELKENDKILQSSGIYRILFTAGLAGSYYLIANKYHFFQCNKKLLLSVGLFSALSFYYAKGLAYHAAGLNAVYTKNARIRQAQLEAYQRQ